MIQNIEHYQNNRDAMTFKGILWAHNSHVGDSRGHHNRAHINIGEYCRRYFGKRSGGADWLYNLYWKP